MKRNASNIDGFVVEPPKKKRPTLDSVDNRSKTVKKPAPQKAPAPVKEIVDEYEFEDELTSSLDELPGYDEINDSMDLIDNNEIPKNDRKLKKALKKAEKQGKNNKKPAKKSKKIIIALTIIALIIGGLFAAINYLWPKDSFDGNWWDVFHNQPLKQDENGFSNILVFGTAPNDYDGPLLADTVLVLSFNQTTKEVYMVSLPRDLWVKHDCPNPALNTTMGKLNETYRCALSSDSAEETDEPKASETFRNKASEITGLDVQYHVHMGWEAVIEVVNSIGGIDITIDSSDPRGIYDVATGIKFKQGEIAHMDGEMALAYARARGSAGGYGLESSNFSREKHQREIIEAAMSKALSTGTLSNPSALMGMIQALGDNVRTNFSTAELQTLANIAKETSSSEVNSLPLIDAENDINLVKTDTIYGASVVVPTAGTYNYTEIHLYIKQAMSSDPVVKEKAVVDVLNGSGVSGLASEKADALRARGFKVGNVANAPTGQYGSVEVYQITDKSATAESLKNLYNAEIKTTIPFVYNTTADFVIVFGAQ